MDVREARRLNIKRLMGDSTQVEFGARVGLSKSHVNQVLSGRAKVGTALARRLEDTLDLERFALDADPTANERNVIDPVALSQIMDRLYKAIESIGLKQPDKTTAQQIARLYAVYVETGAMPDVEQMVRLEALRVAAEQ